MRLKSRNPKATVASLSLAALSSIWRVYSLATTAAQVPKDWGKMGQFLADPPTLLPWLTIVLCIAVLAWSLWPSEAEEDGQPMAPQTTHGPHSPNFGPVHGNVTINNVASPAALQDLKSPYGSAVPARPIYALGDLEEKMGGVTRSLARGMGLKEIKPDMPLTAVLMRVFAELRPLESGEKLRDNVDKAIADTVHIHGLHVWGRIGGRPISLIPPDRWEEGLFRHREKKFVWVGPFSSVEYNDLQFSSAEIDEHWPKRTETTNDGEH